MAAAHQAVVMVGNQRSRSKSMDSKLLAAMNEGLKARQALLPNNAPYRLDTKILPVIYLTGAEFLDSSIQQHSPTGSLQLHHATNTGEAKLLMTPMRNASVCGPALRKFHSDAGAHLARTFLAELVGTEEFVIPHVQGTNTLSYQLRGEEQTLIVALMRGGEPMALGVNSVFPRAQFLHADEPDDIKQQHLEGNVTVILVDSVINNGTTGKKFVQHIRAIHATIRVVIVAGVVQDKAVSGCGLIRELARSAELTVVALRLSQNKYTGTKGLTRATVCLFNTPHLA
ncbi:uracil phosphoribosyltransferase-domain-containing protein [Aspergillus egyptiacus]|nr:uracil phosphoribosyltransferase-domain-containing protein [Aspergillus egyptiacus]